MEVDDPDLKTPNPITPMPNVPSELTITTEKRSSLSSDDLDQKPSTTGDGDDDLSSGSGVTIEQVHVKGNDMLPR